MKVLVGVAVWCAYWCMTWAHPSKQEADERYPSIGRTYRSNSESSNEFFTAPLDPDAEMLPAHYTGVKSPGVDHMELSQLDSRAMASESKPRARPNEESKVATSDESRERKTNTRTGSGKASEENSSYEVEGSRDKGHDIVGYRNVYHKDEYKKNADFYDKEHESGRFKKHGRYGEKHALLEGSFAKGGARRSALEDGKQPEKARSGRKAEARVAVKSMDGSLEDSKEFASSSD